MRPFLFAALCLAALGVTTPANALLCGILGCSCTVTGTAVAFSEIAPFDNTATDAEGDVTVHCTGLAELFPSIVVKANAGEWGTIANRKMRADGGVLLSYNLYTDSNHQTIWGDGNGYAGRTFNGGTVSVGSWTRTRTMYGLVPATPLATPGVYTDHVTLRIDW
ncbi:MAG: spore coat U domain-containing protein [Hyphomonadaceae bacterium]